MLLLEATSYLHTLGGMRLRQFLCLILALFAAVFPQKRASDTEVHLLAYRHTRARAHTGEKESEREILTSQWIVTSWAILPCGHDGSELSGVVSAVSRRSRRRAP
jgi:hypothetical protein